MDTMDTMHTTNITTFNNDCEKFINDIRNSGENVDEKIKQVAGESNEIFDILNIINNIAEIKKKITNPETHEPIPNNV